MEVYDSVLDMIGHTPMLRLAGYDTGPCELFLKLENLNPGGSIKDRIGLAMIRAAEARGAIKPGDTLVEATAGNTGIGLALAAGQLGYRLILVVPDKMSQEKVFNLKAMGAEVVLTRSDVLKGHPQYYQDLGAAIAKQRGAYFINQFANPDNAQAHVETTGPEIWQQLEGRVDAVVVGVGSSGTISGLANFFGSKDRDVELVLADPQGSILAEYIASGELTEGGSWLVEGIGEDFIPEICDFSLTRNAYTIGDAESFATGRELLGRTGVLAGSSSGTLIAAALRYCREQTTPKRVVTFVCDTGNKYLSKQYNDFWMEDQGFIQRERTNDLRDLIGRLHEELATVTVGVNDHLATAHNRLRNAGFSQLPVMQDGELVGIVSEDDIMSYAFGGPERFGDSVDKVMRRTFLRVEPTLGINNLVAMLEVQPYAAVMDGDAFLGLITRADVLNYLRREAAIAPRREA
ncbi:MAG: pyridoxal-phosphate dependent enzyme [Pseudomonadota bacterium]